MTCLGRTAWALPLAIQQVFTFTVRTARSLLWKKLLCFSEVLDPHSLFPGHSSCTSLCFLLGGVHLLQKYFSNSAICLRVPALCPAWIYLLSDWWLFLTLFCLWVFVFFTVVLNTLRHLSTTTSVLSDPSRLPEQAAEAVIKMNKSAGET